MVNSPACCNFRISDFFRFLLLFLARHTIGNVILPPDRALLLLLSRIERRPLVKYYFYYHLIVVLCWLRFFFCFFFLLVGTVLMMCKQNAGACRMEYVVRRRPSHAIKNILLYSNLLFTLCQHKLKCFSIYANFAFKCMLFILNICISLGTYVAHSGIIIIMIIENVSNKKIYI